MIRSRRRRRLGAGLLALLALLLWFLWPRGVPVPMREVEVALRDRGPGAGASLRPDQLLARRGPRRAPPVPTAMRDEQPGKPIIDQVMVEKSEVCRGEENLISVKAHTPGNVDDAFLHYTISGKTGQSVPIRDYGRSKDEPNALKRYISVFGRNNVATTVEVPYYKVKDCDVQRVLVLQHRAVFNSEDEFEFWGKINEIRPTEPFVPVHYLWEFGDGTQQKTTEPIVTHEFKNRKQDAYFSQLVVKCTAVDKAGKKLLGRLGVQMMNPHFQAFAFKGVVLLFFRFTPRFPVLDDDGVVEQTVKVYHYHKEPIVITKATRDVSYRGRAATSGVEEISVTGLLGTNTIPPEGVEFKARLDTSEEQKAYAINYTLTGETREGHRIQGAFSTMRPPDKPTRDKHIPITDPVLHAKIVKAREILGQKFVTDEDIYRLERLGYFRNLYVDTSMSPRTLLPPPEPPKGQTWDKKAPAPSSSGEGASAPRDSSGPGR